MVIMMQMMEIAIITVAITMVILDPSVVLVSSVLPMVVPVVIGNVFVLGSNPDVVGVDIRFKMLSGDQPSKRTPQQGAPRWRLS